VVAAAPPPSQLAVCMTCKKLTSVL
jgi:hypothetical protein